MTACGFRGGLRAGTFSWQTAGRSEREPLPSSLLPESVGPKKFHIGAPVGRCTKSLFF